MHVDLSRFQQHHPDDFLLALGEIEAGQKITHWMWFIFPQLTSLGRSEMARIYGIEDRAEAEAFLLNGMLFRNFGAIVEAVRDQVVVNGRRIVDLMGPTDARKLVSSLTLMGGVSRGLPGNGFGQLADTCDEILQVAVAQGLEPCAITLAFLHPTPHGKVGN